MKSEVREALAPPPFEKEEGFRIGKFNIQIFKSGAPGNQDMPYQVLVRDVPEGDEYWMDNGMRLKTLPLCYYSILLFLTENI